MILRDFASLLPGTVFYVVSLCDKQCVLIRSEIANLGPLFFKLYLYRVYTIKIMGKISSNIFFEHTKIVERSYVQIWLY